MKKRIKLLTARMLFFMSNVLVFAFFFLRFKVRLARIGNLFGMVAAKCENKAENIVYNVYPGLRFENILKVLTTEKQHLVKGATSPKDPTTSCTKHIGSIGTPYTQKEVEKIEMLKKMDEMYEKEFGVLDKLRNKQ